MTVYGWRGRRWFFEPASPLSVLELVNSGTVDLRLASLLWLIMEKRASVLVAAGPSRAGKSTTLNMLLDFLRPEVKRVDLQGYSEDFSFLKKAEAANTYMVAAEFSEWGGYVWGDVAIRAFELVGRGYGLGGTIHARTPREVVDILHQYLGLPLAAIAPIDAIVTLYVAAGRTYGAEPVRRIDTVSLVVPRDGGLALERIARLDSKSDSFDIADKGTLEAALSAKLGIKSESIAPEMKRREQFLNRLLDEGKVSHDEVRQAIIKFYRSQPG